MESVFVIIWQFPQLKIYNSSLRTRSTTVPMKMFCDFAYFGTWKWLGTKCKHSVIERHWFQLPQKLFCFKISFHFVFVLLRLYINDIKFFLATIPLFGYVLIEELNYKFPSFQSIFRIYTNSNTLVLQNTALMKSAEVQIPLNRCDYLVVQSIWFNQNTHIRSIFLKDVAELPPGPDAPKSLWQKIAIFVLLIRKHFCFLS